MTTAQAPHLFIDFATVDRVTHLTGCHCGRCDLNGISYGISIFDVHAFPQIAQLLRPEPPSPIVDAFFSWFSLLRRDEAYAVFFAFSDLEASTQAHAFVQARIQSEGWPRVYWY